jgi:hypothetical protein
MKSIKQLRIQRGHDSPDWQWAIAGIALAVFFMYLFINYGS